MRKMLMIGAAALAMVVGNSAEAAVFAVNGTFTTTVNGATTAGTLKGTFTTNDALTQLTGYELTSSAAGGFSSINYTNGNSTATFLPFNPLTPEGTFLKVSVAALTSNTLTLNFGSALRASGTSLITGSLETQTSASPLFLGTRFLTGTVTAVPEPATWAMMLVGFGLVAGAARYRRKRIVVSFA